MTKISYTPTPNGTSWAAGTKEDPYRITNATQLKSLSDYTASLSSDITDHFVLTDDIDLSAYDSWTPIGRTFIRGGLMGTFDGQGHTITGLKCQMRYSFYPVGLFSNIGSDGTVKNLTIKECNLTVSSANEVGAIAGSNNGLIINCHVVSGSITSGAYGAGGIVGWLQNGRVVACSNSASVGNTGDYSGGIVGYAEYGQVIACFNTGSVSAEDTSDAICGNVYGDSPITACYFTNGTDNSYGTYITEFTQNEIDDMNSALTANGYGDYQYELQDGQPVVVYSGE